MILNFSGCIKHFYDYIRYVAFMCTSANRVMKSADYAHTNQTNLLINQWIQVYLQSKNIEQKSNTGIVTNVVFC